MRRTSTAGRLTSALVFACTLVSCHREAPVVQTPPPPPPPPQSLIVLLPDPGGKATAVTFTNSAGSQNLNRSWQAVHVSGADKPPSAPFDMSADDVQKQFGDLIAALPSPAVLFLLYFPQDSERLTPESEAELSRIFAAVRDRHSTSISLVGHTDTTGDSQQNYRLGLRRAQAVATILIQQGAAESDLSVESHGDADLLINTPRGIAEPRNRRVEVVVY
jgi:outer membrane protein OmpA-like peptidoglycan-associated protein